MSKKAKRTIFCLVAVAACALALRILADDSCTTSILSFTEAFTTETYKDADHTAIFGWTPTTGQGSPIELPRLGANFAMTQPGGLGAHIYIADAGDFNNDGYPDIIGLELTGPSSSYQSSSRLVFLKNNYATTGTSSFTIDTTVLNDPYSQYIAGGSIAVGDFNGDGLRDFFFIRNGTDSFSYSHFYAMMYINVGTATAPKFNVRAIAPNLDFSSSFQTATIYLNWLANHICAVDIDKDGDMDLLAISQNKVYLIRNPGSKFYNQLKKWTIAQLSYSANTGFASTGTVTGTDGTAYTARGGTCVAAADFDNDGDVDVVCGSVNNYNYLVYYKN
ncbi:MAG: VCBS repeat-containing protein, partial [Acidobacteriota bacterium]